MFLKPNLVEIGDIVGSVSFDLETDVVALTLEVLASRADETTPVAYTTVVKEEMEVRLGSQDIPMILNTTPSVYATQQGGGAGDACINVRGFNQRNNCCNDKRSSPKRYGERMGLLV